MKEIFDRIDENKSGCIDIEEFKAGFITVKEVQPVMDQIFFYFDEHHNGLINFPEFLSHYVEHATKP